MTAWWKLSPEALAQDEEAQLAKQMAYYRTFFGTSDGRHVLLDLKMTAGRADVEFWRGIVNEVAIIVLAKMAFYEKAILGNCGGGIEGEEAAINAMASAIKLG